jgi:uncharacterized protein YidB (DUF937 family)
MMSSDGGLGSLLGNLFGGKDGGGGIGKVLQDLLGGKMPGTPGATGTSDKLSAPTPDNAAGPIQTPGTSAGQLGQIGQSSSGGPRPSAPQGASSPGAGQARYGGQQPGMPQGRPGGPQPGMPQSGMPRSDGTQYGQQPGTPRPQPPRTPLGGIGTTTGPAAGGAAAASGLDSLLDRLRSVGLGDQVQSWLSDGPNKSINPQQVSQAIDPQQLSQLAKTAGVSPDEVAQGLAKALPEVVNEMTPHGQIPNASQVQSTITRLFG